MQDSFIEHLTTQTKSFEYPEEWPNLPDQFEITNKSRVYGGTEFSVTFEGPQLTISVSTQVTSKKPPGPDYWTMTIRIGEEDRQIQFHDKQRFIASLASLFHDISTWKHLYFPEEEQQIKGIKNESIYTAHLDTGSFRIVSKQASKLLLPECMGHPLNGPSGLGDLQFIVELPLIFRPHCLNVFERGCIQIDRDHEPPQQEVYAIPSPQVVLNLATGLQDYQFKYIAEDCPDRYDIMASLI